MKKEKKEKSDYRQRAQTHTSMARRVWLWICDYIYAILYVIMLGILWVYLIINWNKCISMQFFTRFNGNNILFIVGLILTILPFYDIEGKGIKLRWRITKSLETKLHNADSAYKQEILNCEVTKLQSENMIKYDGGGEEQ